MAAIRISTGPRYQKTGSPSQKKAKRIAEVMALVMNEALTQPKRQVNQQSQGNASPLRNER
jgi:hypothetical protein